MTCNFIELRRALITAWLESIASANDYLVDSWLEANQDDVSNWIDSDWAKDPPADDESDAHFDGTDCPFCGAPEGIWRYRSEECEDCQERLRRNEAVKTAIRERLADGMPWKWNHSNFECFCYAWKYDILDVDPPLARPAVDPHPFIG